MASGFSTAGANAVINATLRNTALQVAQPYVALHTGAPGAAGSANEVSGNGYARQAATFDAPVDGATDNAGVISFTASGGDWGEIKYVSLWSLASGGVCYYAGALTANKTIANGDSLQFADGALDVTAIVWAGS